MKGQTIAFLGGGPEQIRLANWMAESTPWEVHAIFLESPELSPKVHIARDFRDVLWLCWVLVLPDPVCREGDVLNAPLWPGRPVEAGQFLGSIGKGVLVLAGEESEDFSRAAAAKEVAVTPLPGRSWKNRRDRLLEILEKRKERKVEPRPVSESLLSKYPPN